MRQQCIGKQKLVFLVDVVICCHRKRVGTSTKCFSVILAVTKFAKLLFETYSDFR